MNVHRVGPRFQPPAPEVQLPPGPVAGAPDLEVSTGKLRKRTAALSREAIAAVFELWRAEFERGLTQDAPPHLRADTQNYGDACAQAFIALAVKLWPADEALAALHVERAPCVIDLSGMRAAIAQSERSEATHERKEKSLWQRIRSRFA